MRGYKQNSLSPRERALAKVRGFGCVDDIGPLISQPHGREWSRDILTKIDDPNAVKYTGHTFPPSHEAPSHPARGHRTYAFGHKRCELHLALMPLEDTYFFRLCLLHCVSTASSRHQTC